MGGFLFSGALLYDGTLRVPRPADVAVEGERIKAVAQAGALAAPGFRRIEARGLSLAPGFIDAHSHSDVSILAAPEASGKISQGVTTEIVGNCGLSAFPVLTETVREHLNTLYAACGIRVTWNDLNGYAAELERRKPAVNIASLCGHNTLRANIGGYDAKALSGAERGRMAELLSDALRQGAAGFSTGLLYAPGRFADTPELLRMMAVLKRFDRPYATHLRSEGDALEEALDEAIVLSEHGSGRLQVSHLKTALPRNWNKLERILERIRKAQGAGLRVTADRYPYTQSQTSLSIILPAPYDAMDDCSIRDILRNNPEKRAEAVRALADSGRDWTRVILSSSHSPGAAGLLGKTIAEAAEQSGLSPEAFCVRLLADDAPGTMGAFSGMSEGNLARILAQEWVCCGTDESARPFDESIGRSHPRGFGSFPEFIRRVAAQSSMREAIRRVTSLPASIFGLSGRGVIRPGAYADLVLFDESEFHAAADFVHPHRPASGIRLVCVNGVPSCGDLMGHGGKRSGAFLRICGRAFDVCPFPRYISGLEGGSDS